MIVFMKKEGAVSGIFSISLFGMGISIWNSKPVVY